MEKQTYTVKINAPREKVWQALWDLDNYRNWTKSFSESSNVETDGWKKGSDVKFTDGSGNGMVARIVDNKPNEFMSFEHYGMIQDGKIDTESESVKAWAGSHENYRLKGENGTTELVVELDMTEEWKGFFDQAWPKALEKIKQLTES